MTANLYWRPIKVEQELPCGAPSNFIGKMTGVFGSPPCRLTAKDEATLSAMAAASDDKATRKSFDLLAAAVRKHNVIEFFAEY